MRTGSTAGLANRNAVIASALGVRALAAFHRWRNDRWTHGAWLSALLLAGSLLAGEFGSGTVAYFAAYALFFETTPVRERIRSLMPAGLVVAGWLAMHRLGGYGTSGSGCYFDPLVDPPSTVIRFGRA